jgi:magnesium transporter
MARFLKDRSLNKGQAPGAFILIGQQKMDKPVIQLMNFGVDHFEEKELENISECRDYLTMDCVTWINIYGIHDMAMMQQVADNFGLTSLLMEDILNTDQSPKYDEDESHDAFILKMLSLNEVENSIKSEQLTLILGEKYVLTLQEKTGDMFNPVRDRIRNHKGRVRLNNNDYLAYALLDTLVDSYLILVETIGRKIEDTESKIFGTKQHDLTKEIHQNKIELSFLRKNIRPVKEMFNQLYRSENSFFEKTTVEYLKDLNDLIFQTNDSIELYSSMVSDQLNIYNTMVSNKMNQVMKVLTIFASIFIPLTFIAGIYGMNFEYMPELGFRYSYLIFWIIILLVGLSLVIYFRRKKWM